MLLKFQKFLLSLAILFAMLYLGKLISWLLPIGISDSIWGMLLLFVGLLSGAIRLEWIAPCSRLFTRYMALFFLPICVGVMEQTDLMISHFKSLFIATLVSVVVSMVAIGLLGERVFRAKGGKKNA